ncbi:DUF58 domain-containing protein [Dehalococcoidia bacterium]|nr:DUF58 domain-containing protein [Dehalococcoidia bacterium]
MIILSGSIVLSSGPLIPIALLLLHGFSLYRAYSPEKDTILILATIIIAPLAWGAVLTDFFVGTLVLPSLPLLTRKLRDLAPRMEIPKHQDGWRTSTTYNAIISIIVIAGILGFILGDVPLIGTVITLCLFMICLCFYSLFQLRGIEIDIENHSFQIMSGKRLDGKIRLLNHSSAKYYISLSTNDPHFHVSLTNPLVDSESSNVVSIDMQTNLAGPTEPNIYIMRQDPLGLLWHGIMVQPVTIQVIPKAQYATWLAQRYLDQAGTESYTDMAPMSANNRGVEFSSLRPYHPGDRLRDVDWKHTAKSREAIVREHRDPQAGATIVLVNVVAENPDEADWIAYQMVMSALSAAEANIPVAFSLYNESEVLFSSDYLNPTKAVQQSMQLIDQVATKTIGKRLLSPPNLTHLQRTSQTLATNPKFSQNLNLKKLLDVELAALEEHALLHPVNEALKIGLALSTVKPTISIISHQNHDINALAYVLSRFRAYSHNVINLQTEFFERDFRVKN